MVGELYLKTVASYIKKKQLYFEELSKMFEKIYSQNLEIIKMSKNIGKVKISW